MMKNNSDQKLKWLEKEIKRDQLELDKEKENYINKIKNMKKEEIIPLKPKKITLWQRIKKVLMG